MKGRDLKKQKLLRRANRFVSLDWYGFNNDYYRRLASDLFGRALVLRRQLFVGDHPDIATSLNSLGVGKRG